jgi:hypothetical protein
MASPMGAALFSKAAVYQRPPPETARKSAPWAEFGKPFGGCEQTL